MIARWKGARVIGAIKDESERARAERAGVEVIVDTSKRERNRFCSGGHGRARG